MSSEWSKWPKWGVMIGQRRRQNVFCFILLCFFTINQREKHIKHFWQGNPKADLSQIVLSLQDMKWIPADALQWKHLHITNGLFWNFQKITLILWKKHMKRHLVCMCVGVSALRYWFGEFCRLSSSATATRRTLSVCGAGGGLRPSTPRLLARLLCACLLPLPPLQVRFLHPGDGLWDGSLPLET